jgi:pyruvate,water dikinase
MRTLWSSLAVVMLAGCPLTPPSDHEDAGPADDAGVTDGGTAPEFLPLLESRTDLVSLGGARGEVKFLAQVEGAPITPPITTACAFQNTERFPFHVQFLVAQPGGEDVTFDVYTARVLRRATRVWWGGEVVFNPERAHPLTGVDGELLWSVYTQDSPGNRLTLDDVRAGFARLTACTPGFAEQLAFFPTSNEQTLTVRNGQGELAAEGIAVELP